MEDAKSFAHIIDDMVVNVIICNSLEEARKVLIDGEIIEVDFGISPAFIGGRYDSSIGMFIHPETNIPTVGPELMQQHFNGGHDLSYIIDQYIDQYTVVYEE